MKKTKLILMLLFLLLVTTSSRVTSFPKIANEFYGTVAINGTAADIGANITAYDSNGTLCGFFIVSNQGYYGILSCNGDDPETALDEGAESNDSIDFYVDSQLAVTSGNTSWEAGAFKEVNLNSQNYAPTFDHNLTHQYINESSTLLYDINCSDLNGGDNLTYYDNTTLFDINPATGLISWTPQDPHVGNHSVNITCSDGLLNTSGILNITVYDINNPPVLAPIGNQIAVEGELFTYDVDATDLDNDTDTLIFSTNATIFTINSSTGLINFTPTLSQVGNYSINISVTDGEFTDSEIISFRIVRGPYCGDGSCGSTENCATCPADCGACPSVPPGVAPERAAAERARVRRFAAVCQEKWECTEWSKCSIDGYQTRKCIDINKCRTKFRKPTEIRGCIYLGNCMDGIKNCHDDACEEGIDCGGPCKPCPVEASCSDGIKNCHDDACEEGIDCGGPCDPCEIKKYAKIPLELEKLAPIAKKYPWLLLLLISILISSTITGDRLYIHKITKKEFEDYRKKMRKYKKIKKKIYAISIALSCLTFIISLYIYLLGDKKDLMFMYIWITLAVIAIVIMFVPFIIAKFKYYEYKKQKKEKRFLETDKRKKETLVKIEDKILRKLELKIGKKIYDSIKSSQFEKDIIDHFKGIYRLLINLTKKRKQKLKPLETTKEIKNLLNELSSDVILENISKEYPKLGDVLNNIKKLTRSFTKRKVKEEQIIHLIEEFLLSIIEITADKHLMTVIKSDEKSVVLYNEIVDIYLHYQNQFDFKQNIQKELAELETSFKKKMEEITDKPIIIEKIKASDKSTSLYNSLVDIYNHYKKKEEIYNEIKQL